MELFFDAEVGVIGLFVVADVVVAVGVTTER
jgi:hypothetical protein